MAKIKVDIEELTMALESQSEFGEFFLDKESGEIILNSDYVDDDADAQRERFENEPDRFLCIEPIASSVGWEIMDDFTRTIQNGDAQKALVHALNDRKPFRSFKDKLLHFPDIRDQWFAYYAARMAKIAQDWLEENGVNMRELADHD
jgi:hypothetical protein